MMRKAFLAVAIALAAASPAVAREAIWSRSPNWEIKGFTDVPTCIATTRYPDARMAISLALSNEGWTLAVGGVQTQIGMQHDVDMETTDGNYGTLVGIGISDSVVSFRSLTPATVIYLAKSRAITIQGLGTFQLVGSAAAIKETSACFDAITGHLS